MGNCIRCLSTDPGHPSSPIPHDAAHPDSPATFAYASTTVFDTAKSHFSETVIEGNEGGNRPGLSLSWAEGHLKAFTFAELERATGNFEKRNLIGEGSFGKVFRGWIDERTFAPSKPESGGIVVAIKRFGSRSMIGHEWASEVRFLGRLSHPNLIKLLGYCLERVEDNTEQLLVYEFTSKGSLEDHLFIENPRIEPLSWNLRLKIAIGAARGISFLHRSNVIYRSFKPSNILLDGNYNAKISGFGLAIEGPDEGESYLPTMVIGTICYADPEYIATGYLYVKSDVYGFGVMLLEMMTGLKACDGRRRKEQECLVDWLKPILTDERSLENVMDARMKGQYSSKAMLQAAQIASRCLQEDPSSRPSMDEVFQVLEQIESI